MCMNLKTGYPMACGICVHVLVQLNADRLAAFFWYLEKFAGGPIAKIRFKMKSTTGPALKHREFP